MESLDGRDSEKYIVEADADGIIHIPGETGDRLELAPLSDEEYAELVRESEADEAANQTWTGAQEIDRLLDEEGREIRRRERAARAIRLGSRHHRHQ